MSRKRRVNWSGAVTGLIEQDNADPKDAILLDLLSVWGPDEPARNRILVDNPARLCGFPK
jgi:hypothetical protein